MSDIPKGSWARALYFAEKTPESRNRYVDLLRAIAITCVVMGHWTMAAPYLSEGSPGIEHLLSIEPWTRWLTWLFQVMPVFFFVGGFSNGTSWESNQRKGKSFVEWFSSRLQRLLGPALVLIGFWTVAAAIAHTAGVPAGMIKSGSQISLIPTWFLAVYILVCMMVPYTYRAWQKWGMATVVVLITLAVLMDAIFFYVPSLRWMTWSNFLFIWLAVHQLGYAWREGLKSGFRNLIWGVLGLVTLVCLVKLGPYPTSLVGVPGQTLEDGKTVLSNTRPPKLPLLALGIAQIGLLLSLQEPMKRFLSKKVPWALTILANGMIMTIFLWHSTAMMLLFGVGFLFGGAGLNPYPGSSEWWMIRPIWILLFAVGTLPFISLFQRFERTTGRPPVGTIRQIVGCFACCVGLALLAINGINDDDFLGLRWIPLLLPFIGCGIAGFGPIGYAMSLLGGSKKSEAA